MKSSFKRALLNSPRGFSLIEILIALTLLGIAGGFVASKIFNSLTEGQQQAAKIQIQNLADRLKDFRRKCGYYPTSDQGLEALVTKPSSGRECKNYPPGGFLDDNQGVPKDPWDFDFEYTSDGSSFNIRSFGADGIEGGEGADSDISLNGAKSSPSAAAPESAPQQEEYVESSESGN